MKRPVAVTIIGWLFILAGTVGFIYHARELNIQDPFANDSVWVELVRLLAVAGGILTLRGSNVGRWLLIAWMAYHVILSFFHPFSELIVHLIVLAAVAYGLFHRRSGDFFRR